MPDQLEYVVKDAIMECDKGTVFGFFNPTYNTHVKINKCLVSTTADQIPLLNIPNFKFCSITNSPCVPTPTSWQDPYDVKVKGCKTLLFRSCMQCAAGGKIKFVTSGQIPIPKELKDEILESNKPKADTEGATFLEGFIPIYGSQKDLKHHWNNEQYGWVFFDIVMLIWDIVSVIGMVFAGAGLISQGFKGLARGGVKWLVGAISRGLAKGADNLISLGKKIKDSIDEAIEMIPKKPVGACFVKGTLVVTESGIRKIEDLKSKENVWSYNIDNKEVNLKPIVVTFENQVDSTVKIQFANEIIETTPEHPFFTKKGWKNAANLDVNDEIKTINRAWVKIISIVFLYKEQKVYNFEVEDWHTYFVGNCGFLVHNALKPCLAQMIDDAIVEMDAIKGKLKSSIGEEISDFSLTKNGEWVSSMKQNNPELLKVTKLEADDIGKKYLGNGFVKGKDGYLYSADYSKRYRPPKVKWQSGKTRMNLEEVKLAPNKAKTITNNKARWDELNNLKGPDKANSKKYRYDYHIDVAP